MNVGSVRGPAPTPPGIETPAAPRPDAVASAQPQSATPHAPTGPAPRSAPDIAQAEREAVEQSAESRRAESEALIERIGRQLRIERHSLNFTIDEDLGRTVLTVIDGETEEVIRQIPAEEVLRIAKAIRALEEDAAAGADATLPAGVLLQEQA